MLAQNVVPVDANIRISKQQGFGVEIRDVPLCIRIGIVDGNIDRGIHILALICLNLEQSG